MRVHIAFGDTLIEYDDPEAKRPMDCLRSFIHLQDIGGAGVVLADRIEFAAVRAADTGVVYQAAIPGSKAERALYRVAQAFSLAAGDDCSNELVDVILYGRATSGPDLSGSTKVLRDEMKRRFPWLGTDKHIDYQDQCVRLANWYDEIGGMAE